LLFRLSYPLPYEDEIRSVEGPLCYARNSFTDARRGGPEGTAPEDSPLHYKQQSHAANIPTATIAKPTITPEPIKIPVPSPSKVR